eukprot:gene18045-biopygen2382
MVGPSPHETPPLLSSGELVGNSYNGKTFSRMLGPGHSRGTRVGRWRTCRRAARAAPARAGPTLSLSNPPPPAGGGLAHAMRCWTG